MKKKLKPSFELFAKEIEKTFNWSNVHKTMILLEWYWSFGIDKNGVENKGMPSLETIKNHAYILLKKAYSDEITISTGGFTAGWDNGELFLSFTLEECSAEGIH